MSMPRDELPKAYVQAWCNYLKALEQALDRLEADLQEASRMADEFTDEWCLATQQVMEELSDALFTISEPRWSVPDDSTKIKAMKRRIYDLYVDYRGVFKKTHAA